MSTPAGPSVALPVLRCAGTPREVGKAHGQRFAAEVHASIAVYRDALGGPDHPRWPVVIQACRDASARIATFDAALADELIGIAEGADVDPTMVALLSIRADLLRRRDRLDDLGQDSIDAECTTAAVLGSVTADGHTLMAQNWDKLPDTLASTVVIDLQVGDDPRLLTVTEAGVLMHHGVNDAGVGIVGNALACDRDVGPLSGVPTGVARRQAMRQTTLRGAADAIQALPRDLSGNHLLASAGATDAIDLELVPRAAFTVEPDDGLLVHTNHFASVEAVHTIQDRMVATNRSTRARLVTARDQLRHAAANNEITPASLAALLADHTGQPDAICKHVDPTGSSRTVTVSSSVIDLDTRTLWVAPGPPCQHRYLEISLNSRTSSQSG